MLNEVFKHLVYGNGKSHHKANSVGSRSLVIFCLMSLLASLAITSVQAQTRDTDALPPIIFLLLDDSNECPTVTPSTTFGNGGFITITNQADLNALDGATRIEGSLEFNTPLTNLDFSPLDSLAEVSGDVDFDFSGLESISGFDCLESVNNFFIAENSALTSIEGFSALTTIEASFDISLNDALTSIPEFSELTTVADVFLIEENIQLASIEGFSALITVGSNFDILFNDAFTSINGFNALITVNGDFFIEDNATLASIGGFNNLTSTGVNGSIDINENTALDCTNPAPNFLPASFSTGNFVDCATM